MRKTIILSFDALGNNDAKDFEELDGFKYIIENGAYVKNVQSVYPSLTYPCHASIVTGRYPKDHGVINNLLLQPAKDKKDWFWYEKNISGDTIFRAAKRKGLKVGTVLWPVAAKGNIDCLIPEIIPHGLIKSQALIALLNGSISTILKEEKRHGNKRVGLSQPQLDDYVEGCLHDYILEEDLDIIAVHFIGVDDYKHRYATKSPKIKEAISSYNDRINNLLSLIKENNIDANLIILSDHSQIDVHTAIKLNVLLNQQGYLKLRDNKIFRYKYYMQEAGGSCYIYGKGNSIEDDKILRKTLEEFNKENKVFDFILTGHQAAKLGADPNCVFMIEVKNGYYFADGHNGDIIDSEYPGHHATHGYDPRKDNFSAVLFAYGPDIKNTTINNARLIDIAPTISELQDLNLEGARGEIIDIIKEDKLIRRQDETTR